jgi:hypothetical protein
MRKKKQKKKLIRRAQKGSAMGRSYPLMLNKLRLSPGYLNGSATVRGDTVGGGCALSGNAQQRPAKPVGIPLGSVTCAKIGVL